MEKEKLTQLIREVEAFIENKKNQKLDLLDLNNLKLYFYPVKGKIKFNGIKKEFDKNYKPKIEIKIL